MNTRNILGYLLCGKKYAIQVWENCKLVCMSLSWLCLVIYNSMNIPAIF